MPSLNAGIATLTFQLNDPDFANQIEPTFAGTIAFTVPADVAQLGGKTYTLPAFTLTAKTSSTTISVDIPQFSGSIAVSLAFTTCEVQVSGSISCSAGDGYNWPVGPSSANYLTPPSPRPGATAATTATPISLSTLQQAINDAPSSNKTTQSTMHIDDDTFTRWALEAVLVFSGFGSILGEMAAMGSALAPYYSPSSAASAAGSDADSSNAGGWLIAIGMAGTLGFTIGIGGGGGFFFTFGGDIGIYGGWSVSFKAIAELSIGACISVYWGSAGLSALQCFSGRNYLVTIDAGDVVAGSLSLAWPEDSNGHQLTSTPCGISATFGFGVGLPVDFFESNSTTFLSANVPPPPASGNIIFQGDLSYWGQGLTLYWFNELSQAIGSTNGVSNWSTGAGSFQTETLTGSPCTLESMPLGWVTICGTSVSGGPLQLYMILYYENSNNLQLGATGQQPASAPYPSGAPHSFVATTPPSLTSFGNVPGGLTLSYSFFATLDEALANWNKPETGLTSGFFNPDNPVNVPSGWTWLAIVTLQQDSYSSAELLLLCPYFSGLTGLVYWLDGQVTLCMT